MNNEADDSEEPGDVVGGSMEQVSKAETQQVLKAMRPKRVVGHHRKE